MTTGTFPPGQIFSTRLFLPPAQTTRRPTETPNVGGISVFWSCSTYSVMLSVSIWSDTYVSFKVFWEISHPPSCCFTNLCILLHQLPHPFSWISSHLITWQWAHMAVLSTEDKCLCAIIVNLNMAVVHTMPRTWFRQVEVWRGRQTGVRLVG